MKKTRTSIAAFILIGVLAAGASTVIAANSQSVTAEERYDVLVQVNGQSKTLQDTSGNAAYPLVYNNIVYLPANSLNSVTGMNVNWDPNSSLVSFTGSTGNAIAAANAGAMIASKNVSATNNNTAATPPANNNSTTTTTPTPPANNNTTTTPPVNNNNNTTATNGDIGVEKAKSIALSHAGLSASQVNFIKAHPDWEHGQKVYDVEFYSNNREYDYEISAANGSIVSYDYDIEGWGYTQQNQNNPSSYIGVEKAKSIALSHAGLSASQVGFVKAHLDYDDGWVLYEVEFRNGWIEYDYEIDATNGTILKAERDYD